MNPATRQELVTLLDDIVFWGKRLGFHIESVSEPEFHADQLRCDAVCWCIVCIGEAAGRLRKLAPEMASAFPALELITAYAMRNRIAHGYASLDLGIVWHTAGESIPKLIDAARLARDALSARS